MPVKPVKIKAGGRTRWRTVESATGDIAVNANTGNPVDGGGWMDTAKGRGLAHRQSIHINESLVDQERKKRSM